MGFPFTWISNYGGDVQFNTMPEYITYDQAMRMQSSMGANRFCGCSGFYPAVQTPIMPGVYPSAQYPGVYPQQGVQYGDPSTVQGYIDGRKTRISVIAGQTAQNLTASQTELQTLANDPSTTEEQKNEINKFLTRIQQIQAEIQKAVQNAQTANTPQQLDQINNQIEALAGIAQELQELIPEMLRLLIQEAEQVTPGEDDEAEETPGSEQGGDIQVIVPEGSDPAESLVTTTHKQVSPEVRQITEDIYSAVDGIGFSNSDLETAVNKINKDNVLDVFDNWNSAYAPGYINSDKKGLIETIYGEYHFYNGGKEPITHILNALMEKAVEFGDQALQEIQPLKAKINSELNAFFNTDEAAVAEAINKIVLILNAYQAEKLNAQQAQSTTAQTEEEVTQ